MMIKRVWATGFTKDGNSVVYSNINNGKVIPSQEYIHRSIVLEAMVETINEAKSIVKGERTAIRSIEQILDEVLNEQES